MTTRKTAPGSQPAMSKPARLLFWLLDGMDTLPAIILFGAAWVAHKGNGSAWPLLAVFVAFRMGVGLGRMEERADTKGKSDPEEPTEEDEDESEEAASAVAPK